MLIPLYDEAFALFDSLADEGEIPEVYLGRDGIYAFYGRKAQQQGRKWEVRDGEKMKKQEKPLLKIAPKYLVFPRMYFSLFDDDTQRAYLEQEGVSAGSDPHLFDTGFAGTIPEGILRLLGYSDESLQEHIHLLSSDNTAREIRGTRLHADVHKFDLRSRIINLEHSPKATKSSAGLYRDDSGKIRPIEVASSPRDQLVFQVVKQGIWRHYWIKTLLNIDDK